jgi:dolichyl-diphosphooligosaccharide--protein glycosyltransferase
MQITASVIHHVANQTFPVGPTFFKACKAVDKTFNLGIREDICKPFKQGITLNDICVFIPAYFGALASLFTYALCSEITGSPNTGVVAAAIMAIIPAHLMRSVGGGYDNESVAVTAIVATFYFWVRSVRTPRSWPYGFVAGLAYTYMAAAWGGYVFVVNMVGVHAGILVLLGRYSRSLHYAYTAFFVTGTIGAMTVPIVGMAPIKSMEQAGPLLVFLGMQLISAIDCYRRHLRISDSSFRTISYYIYFVGATFLAVAVHYIASGEATEAYNSLVDAGCVWDIGTRIKSLFVEHTKTGNPLVDSVAEHQSTPDHVYLQYMHSVYYAAKVGFAICFVPYFVPRTNAKIFLVCFCVLSAYFAHKMIRLVLLLAPAASCAAAIACWYPIDWATYQLTKRHSHPSHIRAITLRALAVFVVLPVFAGHFLRLPQSKHKLTFSLYHITREAEQMGLLPDSLGMAKSVKKLGLRYEFPNLKWRKFVALNKEVPSFVWREHVHRLMRWKYTLPQLHWAEANGWLDQPRALDFYQHCHNLAPGLSEPQIMLRGQSKAGGGSNIIDDFREGYWWLRDNTPEDARVMAWWDYGYQITGLSNRTSIADGNTWNHEHIALLGKCLVSSEKKGWSIARHLADYVLVWTTRHAGMHSGDDLAKSPHMARIGGSVYSDVKPEDFWIDHQGTPSAMMRESVLFRLHHHRINEDQLGGQKLKYFEEVYTTTNNMVRIYKILNVSKASKIHPHGSYPPKLQKVLDKAMDFTEVKRRLRLKEGKFD